MKTIFNTCVEITSQEQANRLRQVCIDNGLQIWDSKIAFRFDGVEYTPLFEFDKTDGFAVFNYWSSPKFYQEITESEWMELLEQHNKTKSKSDILTELIDYATTNDNIWLKNQLEKLR